MPSIISRWAMWRCSHWELFDNMQAFWRKPSHMSSLLKQLFILMKIITTNFVKCAVKSCDTSANSFPLMFSDCDMIESAQEYNADFIAHMIERLDWDALRAVANDLGNESLPPNKPLNLNPILEEDQAILKELHTLLIETQIVNGKMTCRNCKHVYHIKNSIPSFLLPPHLCWHQQQSWRASEEMVIMFSASRSTYISNLDKYISKLSPIV